MLFRDMSFVMWRRTYTHRRRARDMRRAAKRTASRAGAQEETAERG
jgi:hypothetical protein